MRMSNHLHNFRFSPHVSSDILVLVRSLLVYDFNCNLPQTRKKKKTLSGKVARLKSYWISRVSRRAQKISVALQITIQNWGLPRCNKM